MNLTRFIVLTWSRTMTSNSHTRAIATCGTVTGPAHNHVPVVPGVQAQPICRRKDAAA